MRPVIYENYKTIKYTADAKTTVLKPGPSQNDCYLETMRPDAVSIPLKQPGCENNIIWRGVRQHEKMMLRNISHKNTRLPSPACDFLTYTINVGHLRS